MSNLIEVKNLRKSWQDFGLQDISFALAPGYIMGFVGPNGAGKSTTIKLMLNLLHKQGGDIKLFGLDHVKDEIAVKQQIGFVLDDTYFQENMTIKQIEWLVSGFYREWDREKFNQFMIKFSLPKHKKIKELSTGMKAKLAMSVALSHNAKLLILDEPTSGLDPVVRSEILGELSQVVQDPARGVFFSTHITSDLDKIADYVTFIHNGRIVLATTKDEINEKYAIVKGTKKQLAEIKSLLVRYKESQFGFEGLTGEAVVLRKQSRGQLVLEKAKIEDIMLYFEKGEAGC
ncbi:ABC transporter related protein [Syntrophobotulus glycolicus DSM 8271]|uniref:ABC transporter related protein n=1 Tax=Syntrophobotulus glycolicus (strain DSM 8271 / FlGlyR) TaxID=645991 RepID=F0SYC3_SYNGF|nr:ABC transporter ATP-binding protein [Syntrophobotulus glycolicus]ADY55958.1 ABC transporter related protein [Syntrophobotulus glycolicus DSM 8271]